MNPRAVSNAGSYGNQVGDDLYRKKKSDGGIVGGDFRDVQKGEGLFGERTQERRMVVSRGNGDTA